MDDVTVYTANAPCRCGCSGAVRMALHPLDGELFGIGPRLPFRVLYRYENNGAFDPCWRESCRSSSYGGGSRRTFDDTDDAIAWLLEGEADNA
jgi:hypothetical protein